MKKLLALVLAGVMVFGVAACSKPAEEKPAETTTTTETVEEDYTVKILQGAALCSAPIYIAVENGYLDEVGVKYEYTSGNTQWESMAAGNNDITYGLLPTFVQRIANGFEMTLVSGAHYGCINVVATDASGIQSIPDLKGKNVGIPSGLGSDPAILLQRMLVAYGVELTDVNLQVYTNADLATALQEGYIEAFVSWDPYATIVSQYEGNHLIFDQAKDPMTADEYCCLFGFSNELMAHPATAKKVVEALTMACDYIAENPVEAAKICYEEGYIVDEDYEFNGVLLDSYRYSTNFADTKASFADVAKDLSDLGIISIKVTPEELADQVFVNVGEIE